MLNLHIILFGEHHSMLLSYWSTVRWYNGTPLVGAHCYSFPIGPPYASIVEPHWLVRTVTAFLLVHRMLLLWNPIRWCALF